MPRTGYSGGLHTSDYALASSDSGWAVLTDSGDTVTTRWQLSGHPAGHYVVNAADNVSTGNALPAGLTLSMVDTAATQDDCQGATVT